MSTDNTEHSRAAAVFTGILTLAAGGAGLLVAGMVLGFDYLLHGDPSERDQLRQARAQQRRDRYADALSWLEADRAERARSRKAKRDWFGEDPTTRGAAPASGETLGRIAGRAWHRMLVGAVRFGRGWKQGREEAQQRRDGGEANWWKPVRVESEVGEPLAEPTAPHEKQETQPSNPQACRFCGRTDQPLVWQGYCDLCAGPEPQFHKPTARPEPEPRPEPQKQQAETGEGDIVDAEIIPDTEPVNRPLVPVGQDGPQRPDETLDEYQRRLADLETEVQQNHNDHRPDPALK